jgi:hypothetical protein
LKWILRSVFIAILAAIVGCDPGMRSTVNIHIETKCQLIGETLYRPGVKVTNSSGSPIAITNVELVAMGKTYANTPAP